jgi:hypothetical protein
MPNKGGGKEEGFDADAIVFFLHKD